MPQFKSKGFLVRGTLRPHLGVMTGFRQNVVSATASRKYQVVPPNNRIPSSISVKRNPGLRG